jgi:hypothetical protein
VPPTPQIASPGSRLYDLHTDVTILAPAHRVWDILVDFPAYGSWNGFIRELSGPLRLGARLRVVLEQPGSSPMTIRPTLVECDPGRGFAWRGRLFIPQIFDGLHAFRLEPLGSERCRFVQSERFEGVLVPFLRSMLETKTRAGFERMNLALKARAEATPAPA